MANFAGRIDAPGSHWPMKLKNQILAHSRPLRADKVQDVFHASLLLHNIKVG